jgi:hypothetical protein
MNVLRETSQIDRVASEDWLAYVQVSRRERMPS